MGRVMTITTPRPDPACASSFDLARMLARMPQVNMHEAKTRLSELVERSLNGERIVLARSGRPVAEIVPYNVSAQPRRGGRWHGAARIPDDFDAPAPDVEELFGAR